MQYTKDTIKIAEFINDKISYAKQHKKQELDLLYEFVDLIGDLMEAKQYREEWYNMCNTIPPEQKDDNSIS